MTRTFLFVSQTALAVCALFAGVLHGRLSNRWHSVDLEAAGTQLEALSDDFGDWELVETAPLESEVREMLQCRGSFQRKYRHRKTGQAVRLAMIVGPGGPTAVHVPEICFSSQAFEQLGDSYPLPVETAAGTYDFRGIDFRSKDLMATKLLVAYAWTTDGIWSAPQKRRWALAGERILYKLQLSTAGSDEKQVEDPRQVFLRDFIPFASAHLFPAGSGGARSSNRASSPGA